MKKLNIEVIRTDRYYIIIDEKVWGEPELKEWSSVFNTVTNIKELAENLSYKMSRQGIDSQFYEGFGHVAFYNINGKRKTQYIYNKGKLEEIKDYCGGIMVIVSSHDEEYEFETSEEQTI